MRKGYIDVSGINWIFIAFIIVAFIAVFAIPSKQPKPKEMVVYKVDGKVYKCPSDMDFDESKLQCVKKIYAPAQADKDE